MEILIGMLVCLAALALFYSLMYYMKGAEREEAKRAEKERQQRKREEDARVEELRNKMRLGLVSTGLMPDIIDPETGEETPFEKVRKEYESIRDAMTRGINPRETSVRHARLLQSIMIQFIVVDPDDVTKVRPLDVQEMVRHLIGTWGFDVTFYRDRMIPQVDIHGNVKKELPRVEITDELLVEAANLNGARSPLKGTLMHRGDHIKKLMKRHTPVEGTPPVAPGHRRTEMGTMAAIQRDENEGALSLDTSGNSSWKGQLAPDFTND